MPSTARAVDVRATTAPQPPDAGSDQDASTRRQVLHLVAARGPVAAGDLAAALGLTTPAVRRHLAALEADGHVVARDAPGSGQRGRGRPARLFVVTRSAHDELPSSDAELAVDALGFLARMAGEDALRAFAAERSAGLERRYSGVVAAAGPSATGRAEALAGALAEDGYEATTRPVPGMNALQLCQGHCPVGHVAATFPQLCEAETQAFSRLLGVHVQRLATLAGGGHACTTHIPTGLAPASTSPTPVEGPR